MVLKFMVFQVLGGPWGIATALNAGQAEHSAWDPKGIEVQHALAASLLAPSGLGLVVDQRAAPVPKLDWLLDGQRWAFEPADLRSFD